MAINRSIYILILIGSVALTQIYSGHFSSVLLLTVIAVPLLSLVLTLIQLAGLKVKLNCDAAQVLIRGERLTVRIPVKSFIPLPISLASLQAEMPDPSDRKHALMIFSLTPAQRRSFNLVFPTVHRGEYDIRINSVTVYDMFRLFKLKKKVNASQKAVVIPRIYDIDTEGEKFLLSQSEEADRKAVNSTAGERSFVRKYTDGDDIKRIHWKLSSKHDDYMVWQQTKGQEDRIIIFCDLKNCGSSRDEKAVYSDAALELGLAAALICVKRDVQTVICCFDRKNSCVKYLPVLAPQDISQAAVLMASLEAYEEGFDLTDTANEAFSAEGNFSGAMFITRRADSRLLSMMKNICVERRISLLLTEKADEETQAQLELLSDVRTAQADPENISDEVSKAAALLFDA